jgi:hypothetical protein
MAAAPVVTWIVLSQLDLKRLHPVCVLHEHLQCGIGEESTRGPVEVLVIDRAERPSVD